MFTMILVEDEPITREGLLSLPLWERLDIRIVSVQKNAQDGLRAILTLSPDIVLTDIYMPGNTGLWMAEQALAQHCSAHFVIVSAYDKVKDLRQAIQLGAVDYILKPVVYAELESCMERTIGKIQQDRSRQSRLSALETRAVFDLRKKKQETLERLLLPPEPDLADACREAELCLHGPRLQALVLSLEGQPLPSFSQEDFVSCVSLPFEILRIQHHVARFALFLALEGEEEEGEDISAMALRLREKINVEQNRTVGIGIGLEVSSVDQLHQSYQQAREALTRRLYLGRNQIISYDEPFAFEEKAAPTDLPLDMDTALQQGSLAIRRYVEGVRNSLFQRQLTVEQCHHRLIGEVYKAQQLLGLTSEEKEAFCRQTIQLISQSETIDEMCEILHGFLSEADKSGVLRPDDTDVVDRVKRFIDAHFAENISISDLAREVYLSPTYLCLLFRRREEMTINEYVTLRRMEKAKQLLTLTRMPLSEISLSIGYENPGYFARRFRDQTGKLPSEYRKEMTEGKKKENKKGSESGQ